MSCNPEDTNKDDKEFFTHINRFTIKNICNDNQIYNKKTKSKLKITNFKLINYIQKMDK